MEGSQVIYDFVSSAIESGGWMKTDRAYLQNKLTDMTGVVVSSNNVNQVSNMTAEELCQILVDMAKDNKVNEYQTEEDIDQLKQSIMELLTPPPSVVNAMFAKKFDRSPLEATNYLYWLNQINGYLSGGKETSYGIEFDAPMHGKCPLCFENEGTYEPGSAFLKKTRRFIRLNLNNDSWGYQLSPLEKDKEVGLFFPEEHTTLFMTNLLIDQMVQLVDLYTHYEIHYSQFNYFYGHSFLVGKRVNKDRQILCEYTLPFFRESKFAYDMEQANDVVIQTNRPQDIWLMINYIFSLTVSHKRGLYTMDFDYYLSKTETDYQMIVSIHDNASNKSKDNWLFTLELLKNELEVRY